VRCGTVRIRAAQSNGGVISGCVPRKSGCVGWRTECARIWEWSLHRWDGRVRAVDATSISEQGSTGTDWRIHYAINLKNLQCDFFLLTDVPRRGNMAAFSCVTGDIMLGDRGYATAERSSACSRSKRGRGGTVKPRELFPCLTKRGSVSAILKKSPAAKAKAKRGMAYLGSQRLPPYHPRSTHRRPAK